MPPDKIMSEPRPKGMASLSAWQHEEKSVHILLGATRRRVAETQRYRQLSAALHKFKVRSDAATLYLALREAMPPAFSDVSSLNLAAFSAANFFAHSPTPCKPKSIRQRPP